jgi:hypothetical protein
MDARDEELQEQEEFEVSDLNFIKMIGQSRDFI